MDKKLFRNMLYDSDSPLIREERYEIQIENETIGFINMAPANKLDFIKGYLFSNNIISKDSDLISFRVCDANRFYIYLSNEIKDRIIESGGVKNYILSLPSISWGDLIYIESKNFEKKDIIDSAINCADTMSLERDSNTLQIASFNCKNEIFDVIRDFNPVALSDKFFGKNISNSSFTKLIITNTIPDEPLILKVYKLMGNYLFSTKLPTAPAYFIAKKTGISIGLILKSECKFIT